MGDPNCMWRLSNGDEYRVYGPPKEKASMPMVKELLVHKEKGDRTKEWLVKKAAVDKHQANLVY